MDGAAIWKAMGAGAATGGIIAVALLIVLLPASWVMNRFIYHSAGMRVVMGIIAILGSAFSFLILVTARVFKVIKEIRYISLLPVWETTNIPAKLTDIRSRPGDVLLWDPFNFQLDVPAIKETIKGFIAEAGEAVVDEKLYNDARDAAAITDYGKWKTKMAELAPPAKDQSVPPAEEAQ